MIFRRQQFVDSWIMALIAFFWIETTVNGSAFPLSSRPIFIKNDHPFDVVKRLPVTVLDTSLISTKSFLETAAMVVPIGLIWKIGDLRSLGWKVWVKGAVKMGSEWGSFSAIFSGGEKFFSGIRGIDDKYNQFIACGLCSAIHKIKEGYVPMAREFATGFAFMYMLDKLTASMSNPEIEEKKRQMLDGNVATKGTTTSSSVSNNINRSKVTSSQHRVTAARRAALRNS